MSKTIQVNSPTEFDIKVEVKKALSKPSKVPHTIEILKNFDENNRDSYDFNKSEITWLRYNLPLIPDILESDVACGLIYWLYRDPGSNLYATAKRLGVHYNSVRHWFKKFYKIGIVKMFKFGINETHKYYLNDKWDSLIGLILEEISEKYGKNINNVMQKNQNIVWETIKKSREKQANS